MTRRTKFALVAGFVAVGIGVVLANTLPDPRTTPDGLVFRALPPLAAVEGVRTSDGEISWADEIRESSAGVRCRRGPVWTEIPSGDLAEDWRVRTRAFLGTDQLGRDLSSRMLWGGLVSLAVGALGALVALSVGTAVGLVAGFLGGVWDALLMRVTDVVLSVPRLFLAMLLVALYGRGLGTTILVLGFTTWMPAARVVRGQVLTLRRVEFVEAARAAGAAPWRQAIRHVLPVAAAPLFVEAALRMGEVILLETSLSFLELGVRPPTPTWGNIIADGRNRMLDAWWIATLPGLAVAATVLVLTRLGDGLRRPAGGRRTTV